MHESPSSQYDALPYEGHPDPMIHPDRMAAAAWLHGINAPPLENARILEIGCATGAHLIPMAYQLPNATLVGFDFSATQIASARATAATIGLQNVNFNVRDIRESHTDLGEFDYIFAHGVYSWVPQDVQKSLLQLCRQHLAPAGVALVDYNVYPGWHQREFLRDLMQFHQKENIPLSQQTDSALNSLQYIASHLFAPSLPFGQSVGQLQRWAADQSKNYLAHEFGGSPIRPVTFCEFAAHAKCENLEILGDSEMSQVIPAQCADSLAAKLDEVAGADYVRREQFLDFLRGRDFRRTLLVHDSVQFSRQIQPKAMEKLRLSTVARHEPLPQGALFRTPDGVILRTVNVPLIGALRELCNSGAVGLSFDSMFGAACSKAGDSPPTMEAFTASLLEAVASGLVQVHAHRPRVINQVSNRPLANSLARAAAASGQDVATSMLHRDWRIDRFEKSLILLLDGTKDRLEIAALLSQELDRGDCAMGPPAQTTHPAPRQQVETHLSSSLEWFARVGILVR